jgi:RNase P subunit RPR2
MITMLDCPMCGKLTLHEESTVADSESATVWHCLICGHERRPSEPGSPNRPVRPTRKPPNTHGVIKMDLPKEKKRKQKELVDA